MSWLFHLLERRPVTAWHARLEPAWRMGAALLGLSVGMGFSRGWSTLPWVELAGAIVMFAVSLWCGRRIWARTLVLVRHIEAHMVGDLCPLTAEQAAEYEALTGEPLKSRAGGQWAA